MTDVTKYKRVLLVDDDKNTKTHYAAAFGNMEELSLELEENLSKIDVENYLGWTPLMMACRNGQSEIVRFLLEKNADATKKNKFGYSVFLMCVASGDLDLIKLILEHLLSGGVTKQTIQRVLSPLSVAVLYNHPKVVKYLIEKSFDVNAPTLVTLNTPLMFAKAMDNSTIYNILLQHEADAFKKNYLGMTAKEMEPLKCRRLTKPTLQLNIDNGYYQQPPPQVPMIVISPQPQFFSFPASPIVQVDTNSRKSSNIASPNFYLPPNVTPITPINMVPQVFFPPDFDFTRSTFFSTVQAPSPQPHFFATTPDILNRRISTDFIFSPYSMNFPSPCL